MNNRKRWKRAAAFLTALATAASMLTGCGKGETKKEAPKEPQAKGRFAEREIALPETEGRPIGILFEDGQLRLYSCSADEEHYQSYGYENESWSEPSEEPWLNEASGIGQRIAAVFLGQDGSVYAKTRPTEDEGGIKAHILKESDSGSMEEVTPENSDEKFRFTHLAVLEDGTIGVSDFEKSKVEFYKDGAVAFSVQGIPAADEEQVTFEAGEKTIALFALDGSSVEFYDAESFEKKNTVKTGQDLMGAVLLSGENGAWYIVNRKGIHRIHEDGSMTETIMEGSDGLMGNDHAWFLRKFISGEDGCFYGLYSNVDHEFKLMRYAFDEKAAAVREKTLSVYSLKENETVNQAIYEFQNRHPEVQVDYRTAVEGNEKPTSDHIRTLNTELLAGNGADVLILDGLPFSSYMEKGVLADLSGLAKDIENNGVLSNVIETTAKQDGKIYALPARIGIPVIYGTKEEVEACETIDTLTEYASSQIGRRLFGATCHTMSGMTLFHMFLDEMRTENGTLREEKLAALLKAWMQLCENGDFKRLEKKYFDYAAEGVDIWKELDKTFCSTQGLFGEDTGAAVTEIFGMNFSLMTAYTEAEMRGSELQSLKGYFIPQTIAGINASSGEKALAADFVKTLFSETVQQIDTWDGFPVLSSVLDGYPAYVESDEAKEHQIQFSTIDMDNEQDIEGIYRYPDGEAMKNLLAMIRELKKPFTAERLVSDMVQEELEKCYAGAQSPEETAAEIVRKMELYAEK